MEFINYYRLFEEKPRKLCDPQNNPEDAVYAQKDEALLPATFDMHPDPKKYDRDREQQWTVCCSAVTKKGRIFFNYFSSCEHASEDAGIYNMVMCSDDHGQSFRNLFVLESPVPERVRIFDMRLWTDEQGRLWMFWNQCFGIYDGRFGVWASRCDDPDGEALVFSAPKRICDGVLCRYPIVTKDGSWLIPTSIWDPRSLQGIGSELGERVTIANWQPEDLGVSVYRSVDQGESYEKIASGIRFPYSVFDEPGMVEKNDGSLWMWIRGMNCIAEVFSYDGGYTWTEPRMSSKYFVPNSRFELGRLKSGNLLLLQNYKPRFPSLWWGRNNLTALLSRDDGETWEGVLMLDEREGTEQPGYTQADDGTIYISYGRAPGIAGEGLMAIITEEDILAGKLVNPNSRLRVLAGKARGMRLRPDYAELCEFARKAGVEM